MLSPDEQREIEAELANYEFREAAGIEALKVVQRHRGWVSDEALADLEPVLGLSAAELDAVATFYDKIYRKPVGRHVIFVCSSISCWVMGYENVRDYLLDRLGILLGQTTADNRFTVLPTACLGACDLAPVMLVDDDLYGNLTPPELDTILARYE
ncbi:MAG: NADH-quinone oxidoreductase subunit NuoE [Dehalococcoidales bacterium]|nr:NADH-quinone oxidoreductase subunit NuoE [Dehalococcoidales bacterium]